MTKSLKFELDAYEIARLKAALDLFISNEIEGIPFKRKQDENALALSTIKKLSNLKNPLIVQEPVTAENFRIMGLSLLYFEIIIDETTSDSSDIKFVKDRDKYLPIISDLLDKIESTLNTIGYSLYSE